MKIVLNLSMILYFFAGGSQELSEVCFATSKVHQFWIPQNRGCENFALYLSFDDPYGKGHQRSGVLLHYWSEQYCAAAFQIMNSKWLQSDTLGHVLVHTVSQSGLKNVWLDIS